MPCNSDYFQASNREIELSKVECLLDELDGKREIDKRHWSGYHPKVYNKNVDGDKLVRSLCKKLQGVDVSKYSLEMQIWWRDHQIADKARLEHELSMKRKIKDRKIALSKLSNYEKKLLGLED